MTDLVTKQIPLDILILKKRKREEHIKEHSLNATG